MKKFFIDLNLRVSDLIDHRARDWDNMFLDDLLYPQDINIILAKKLAVDIEDFWVWKHTKGETTLLSQGMM